MDEKEVKSLVGKRVRAGRKLLNLTQTELGNLINISQRQVALIENGYSIPQLSTLVKIANVFNCEIEDFYRKDEFLDKTEALNILNNLLSDSSLDELREFYSILKVIRQESVGEKKRA